MEYDVIVIGGGPAGMMAAGRAGELGSRVLLLEKNENLGLKLLTTGNGRCNFTNAKHGPKEFLARFGANGKFLFSGLHQFGVDDAISFFETHGVRAKIEQEGKVFPVSDKAQDVLSALKNYMKQGRVTVKTGAEVKKIVAQDSAIEKIILADGTEMAARNYIISTGGKSYPKTGSTGDGYKWARELGHTIIEPKPALTSVVLRDPFIKELQGLSFSNIKVSIYGQNKKIKIINGDIIFTDNGISGPAVMDITRELARENLRDITLKLDFFPDQDFSQLDKMLQTSFNKEPNKLLKNILAGIIPPRLVEVALKLTGVEEKKKANEAAKDQRKKLSHLLKEFNLAVSSLSGFDRAYITSGGIALNEVDPKTMRSKFVNNLFLAGEVLDLDGPTGGYNLQVAWTTGYAAGSSAAA